MLPLRVLCSKNEYTKSESNSQQRSRGTRIFPDCVQRTNIQNLKAIHNSWAGPRLRTELCSKNEYTKSESNSQLDAHLKVQDKHCVQRTNIQNLKAIHNHFRCVNKNRLHCVQRTNIQNLKAIHNVCAAFKACSKIVFKERIYKI